MEEEKKKKKRNKKKKNKQGEAAAEDVQVAGNGQVSESSAAADVSSDHVAVVGNGQVSEAAAAADVGSDAVQDAVVNPKRHENETNGTECSLVAESEKRHWLQREATLEEKINQLQKEKYFHIQKEAALENSIKQFQVLNDSHIQNEASLEDTIKQLRDENDSRIQKEAGLQMEIVQLQSEKHSWLHKEEKLQEKIKHLERDRDAWILKEDSVEKMTATLKDDIAGLRTQVLELDQSRNNLVQENQQLMGNLSSLQLQIKNLESVSSTRSSDELAKHASEREDLNSQIEAAVELVEKLIVENAELVEKVTELCVELDRRSATDGLSSTTESNTTGLPAETASVINPRSRPGEDISTTGQKVNYPEVPIKQEMHSNGNMDSQHAGLMPNLPVSDQSSEIVQIPLDKNEVRDLESQSAENDKNDAVPITDAPLIGAPFRLMSFVASYVTGADLVNKSSY